MASETSPFFIAQVGDKAYSLRPNEETGKPPQGLQVEAATASSPEIGLHADSYDQVIAIVSTLSGSQFAVPVFETVLGPLLKHLSVPFRELRTQSAESVRNFAQEVLRPQALSSRSQLVILLSGDGGIVDLLSVLAEPSSSPSYRPPTIALIPVGTGNALGHSSGILSPRDQTLGLRTLLRGKPRVLPVFKVDFTPAARRIDDDVATRDAKAFDVATGAVVFSWALHAALVADSDTPEYRKHGAERFQMAAKENLFPADGSKPHAYRGRVSLLSQGKWHEIPRDTHNYVLITMCAKLEANFTISPESKPLDGELRAVHMGAVSGGGEDVMDALKLAYQGGKHVEIDTVGYQAAEAFRLTIDEEDTRWRRVCIDGTIFVVERGGQIEVSRRQSTPILEILHIDI